MQTTIDGRVSVGTMLRGRLADHKAAVILVTSLLVGEIVIAVLQPWPMKFVIDYLIAVEGGQAHTRFGMPNFTDSSIGTFLVLAATMILSLVFFDSLVSFLGKYYRSRLGADVGDGLRRDTLARLQRLDLPFHAGQRDELTNHVVKDTQVLGEFLAHSAPTLVRVQATFVGMIVIMFWLDWRLTFVALVLVPPVAYIATTKFSPTLPMLMQIGAAIIIVFGVLRVASGALSTGDLWVFLAYFRGAKRLLKDLGDGLQQWERSQTCYQRVRETLETESTDLGESRWAAPALAGGVTVFTPADYPVARPTAAGDTAPQPTDTARVEFVEVPHPSQPRG